MTGKLRIVRGPELGSQDIHGGSQSSVIPVSRAARPSTGLYISTRYQNEVQTYV